MGRYHEYDLYFHNKSSINIIARFGDGKDDCESGMGLWNVNKPLHEASERAVKMGLVSNSFLAECKFLPDDLDNIGDDT